MSAAEHSRDDAEPPSRSLNRITFSLSIEDAVDGSSVPPADQLSDCAELVVQRVKNNSETPTHFEVSVSVVDEAAIQALNLEYRFKDQPTNVLSFPSGMPLFSTNPDEMPYQVLGDVVVCQSVITREASEHNKSTEHHFIHMLVHSLLHLFHYDHETESDAAVMEALEIQLLAELSIPNPYQLSFQNT